MAGELYLHLLDYEGAATASMNGTELTIPAYYAMPPVSSELSVTTVDGRAVIGGTGNFTVTVTEPAEYAGTYSVDRSGAGTDPINHEALATRPQCLVPPRIVRYKGPGAADKHYPGTEYEYIPGLWLGDPGREITVFNQWWESAVATGYDGPRFSRAGTGDVILREYVRYAGDSSSEARAWSNLFAGEAQPTVSTFNGVAEDTKLLLFADPTDRVWLKRANQGSADMDIHTGTDGRGYVRGVWGPNNPYALYAEMDAGATMARAGIRLAPAGAPTMGRMGVALHFDPIANSPTLGQFYFAMVYPHSRVLNFGLMGTGSAVQTWFTSTLALNAALTDTDITLDLLTSGNDVIVRVNGTEVTRATNTAIRGGFAGIASWSATPTTEVNKPYGVFSFDSE